MKDFVLGSDEFFISFYELLGQRLSTCTPTPVNSANGEPEIMGSPERDQTSHQNSLNSSPTSTNTPETDPDQSQANPEED